MSLRREDDRKEIHALRQLKDILRKDNSDLQR